MIEPEIRNDHLRRAMADPHTGVVLVDVVLGYGAHENPAGVLCKAISREKTVIASVTGTEQDPQGWSRQAAILREAGVIVAASNAHAAELAASLGSGDLGRIGAGLGMLDHRAHQLVGERAA